MEQYYYFCSTFEKKQGIYETHTSVRKDEQKTIVLTVDNNQLIF